MLKFFGRFRRAQENSVPDTSEKFLLEKVNRLVCVARYNFVIKFKLIALWSVSFVMIIASQ